MYNQQMYARMVRFQRTAMDNTFAIFTSLQGYGDKILKKSLEQSPWLPDNSKKTCIGLSDTCLYGSKNLRKFIDQGFDEMERLVSRAGVNQESDKKVKSIPAPLPAQPTARKQAGGRKPAALQKTTAPEKSSGKSSGTQAAESPAASAKSSAAPPPATTPEPKSSATPAPAPGASRPAPPASPTAATSVQPSGLPDKNMKENTKNTGNIS